MGYNQEHEQTHGRGKEMKNKKELALKKILDYLEEEEFDNFWEYMYDKFGVEFWNRPDEKDRELYTEDYDYAIEVVVSKPKYLNYAQRHIYWQMLILKGEVK